MKTTCDLCLIRETSSPYRAAGLDICAMCWSGGLADACDAWGLDIEARHWVESVQVSEKNRVQFQFSEVRVALGTPSPVHARFDRDHPPPAWLRWLGAGRGDPEVGDPLFDDYVKVIPIAGQVLALLSDEGLQTGISTVTAEGGFVAIADKHVKVRQRQSMAFMVDHGEVNARALAIAVCVERFARGV